MKRTEGRRRRRAHRLELKQRMERELRETRGEAVEPPAPVELLAEQPEQEV